MHSHVDRARQFVFIVYVDEVFAFYRNAEAVEVTEVVVFEELHGAKIRGGGKGARGGGGGHGARGVVLGAR